MISMNEDPKLLKELFRGDMNKFSVITFRGTNKEFKGFLIRLKEVPFKILNKEVMESLRHTIH